MARKIGGKICLKAKYREPLIYSNINNWPKVQIRKVNRNSGKFDITIFFGKVNSG